MDEKTTVKYRTSPVTALRRERWSLQLAVHKRAGYRTTEPDADAQLRKSNN